VASPKQLGEILFNKIGLVLKNQKKTSTGALSTRESELEKMKDLHPIIPKILEYREISKLISTYIKPIQILVDPDSRLHADFIQTGTTTGRMSSENPNLQNIPVSSQRGLAIRKAFIAPRGFSLVAFDYSQIELRIASILSKDERLITVFKDGGDAHRAVASMVFDCKLEEVTKEMRRQAKVINFGILYGMGVNALKTNLGSDRKTAQEFLNAYFKKFNGLASYLEGVKEEAFKNGYTETLFGRRRYFEGIKSRIPYIRASAERMAINAPIQGTQADIIKIAMRRINDYVESENLDSKAFLILQIHDELVFEVDDSIIDPFVLKVKSIMETILSKEETFGVPIIANSAIGPNWANLE
jgi:DNA polymerase-1